MVILLETPYSHSSGNKLTPGGLALLSAPTIWLLACSSASSGVYLRLFSIVTTIWAVGTIVGAEAKFKPLFRTASSASDRGLGDRFITRLGPESSSKVQTLLANVVMIYLL